MKKFKIRVKNRSPPIKRSVALINLYLTQALTLIAGLIWILFQQRNPFGLFVIPKDIEFVYWGSDLPPCW